MYEEKVSWQLEESEIFSILLTILLIISTIDWQCGFYGIRLEKLELCQTFTSKLRSNPIIDVLILNKPYDLNS
jgi:hypothetical protein